MSSIYYIDDFKINVDNLNLITLYSEDGTLLKEIHLTRIDTINRYIINTYGAINTISINLDASINKVNYIKNTYR